MVNGREAFRAQSHLKELIGRIIGCNIGDIHDVVKISGDIVKDCGEIVEDSGDIVSHGFHMALLLDTMALLQEPLFIRSERASNSNCWIESARLIKVLYNQLWKSTL